MEIARTAWYMRFRQSTTMVSKWFETVGLVAVVGMVLIAIIDVIGTKALKWPLPGSTELTGIAQIVAIAGGLAFSKINGNHIAVTFLPDWLKGRGKAGLEIFISVLGLGLFVIAGWMTYEYGLSMFDSGEKTQLLEIVFYPFAFWIALCCIPMCFVIIIELLNAVGRVLK